MSEDVVVVEDNVIDFGDCSNIFYHHNLNVILANKNGKVCVYDPHTSEELCNVSFNTGGCNSGQSENFECIYHKKTGGLIICKDNIFNYRQCHQGVLLLNTFLQTHALTPEECISFEMLYSEAVILHQVFQEIENVEISDRVKLSVREAIYNHPLQDNCSLNPKIAKWNTVVIRVPFGELHIACARMVDELRRLSYYVPALSLASAIVYRLTNLMPPIVDTLRRHDKQMYSEAARLLTFSKWPHVDYKWVSPEQMAQAGFYHQSITNDADRTTCFICNLNLISWEPNDEPWSEHERHAPNCPFVKGEHTDNVPMSVTLASNPAMIHSKKDAISCVSESNSEFFVATATRSGNIVVWNISRQLKKETAFLINPSDPIIVDKHFSDLAGYTDVKYRPFEILNFFKNDCQKSTKLSDESDVNNYMSVIDDYLTRCNLSLESSTSPNNHPIKCDTKIAKETAVTGRHSVDDVDNFDGSGSKSCVDENAKSSKTSEMERQIVEIENENNSTSANSTKTPPNKVPINCSGDMFSSLGASDVQVTSLCVITDGQANDKQSILVAGVTLNRYSVLSTPGQSVSTSKKENSDKPEVVNFSNENGVTTCDEEKTFQQHSVTQTIELEDVANAGCTKNSPFFYSGDSEWLKSINQIDCGFATPQSINQIDFGSATPQHLTKYFVPYLLVYDLTIFHKNNNKKSKSSVDARKKSKKGPIVTSPFHKQKHNVDCDMEEKTYSEKCKSQGKTKNFVTPKCIQCIPLPYDINDQKQNLTVSNIVIINDVYILITMEDVLIKNSLKNVQKKYAAALLLYRIDYSKTLAINSEPEATKLFDDFNMIVKSVIAIPNQTCRSSKGLAAFICIDGVLRILSLNDFDCIREVSDACVKFKCATYCQSVDGLCAVKENGKVALIKFSADDETLKDFHSYDDIDFSSNSLVVNRELCESSIEECAELTISTTVCQKFVATVPSSWIEVVQAQVKRRNPQHLQHQVEGAARTWKVYNDMPSSFYLIDFMLSSSRTERQHQVSHINVNFCLNQLSNCDKIPEIQITLLKQNVTTSSINTMEVSEKENSEASNLQFLLNNKDSILCGPISVNRYLNSLSQRTVNVTLISRKLFEYTSKSFLIHISINKKTNNIEDDQISSNGRLDTQVKSGGFEELDSMGSTSSNKNSVRIWAKTELESDLIREVTLNVHCCYETGIPNERIQRLAIINSSDFHAKLFSVISSTTSSTYLRHRSIDILQWISSIYINENLDSGRDNDAIKNILKLLETSLQHLIRNCLLSDDRSLSRKITKMIVTFLESIFNAQREEFEAVVLRSLLECFDDVIQCKSAGGVFWFFSLLNLVKFSDSIATANKIALMLTALSKAESKRISPLYSFIQNKYEFDWMPLERKIFDMVPSLHFKPETSQNMPQNRSYMVHMAKQMNAQTPNDDYKTADFSSMSHISDILSRRPKKCHMDSALVRDSDVGFGSHAHVAGLCGLLEVEPLHFSLFVASDGTSIENIQIGNDSVKPINSLQSALKSKPSCVREADFTVTQNSEDTCTQISKAIEDMENMLEKNDYLENLLSEKVEKSFAEKLKRSAKQNEIEKQENLNAALKVTLKQLSKLNEAADSSKSWSPSTLSHDPSPESSAKCAISDSSSSTNKTSSEELYVSEKLLNLPNIEDSSNLKETLNNGENYINRNFDSNDAVNHNEENKVDNIEQHSLINSKNEDDISDIDKSSTKQLKDPLTVSTINGNDKVCDNNHVELLAVQENGVYTSNYADETDDSTTETLKDPPSSQDDTLINKKFLSIPPEQVIVIERMHSGARRFVVLDFGMPIALTDVILPACGDLASLTIDVWLNCEENGDRVTVASDINVRPLILADLQPPPICQYLKITVLGRYEMLTTQCRIPVGAFYGHTVIMPWYLSPSQKGVTPVNIINAKKLLAVYITVAEDVSCRYTVACNKLKFFEDFVGIFPEIDDETRSRKNYAAELENKILTTFLQECLTEQLHLNLIASAIYRLNKFVNESTAANSLNTFPKNDIQVSLKQCSHDQLNAITQNLLNCLLTISFSPTADLRLKQWKWCGPAEAKSIIERILIRGSRGVQISVLFLLSHLCSSEIWWGSFIASTLVSLFSTKNSLSFPRVRIFSLFVLLAEKNMEAGSGSVLINAIIETLSTQLQSIMNFENSVNRRTIFSNDNDSSSYAPSSSSQVHQSSSTSFSETSNDTRLVSWLLMYLSMCLDFINEKKSDNANRNRWDWIKAESSLQKLSDVDTESVKSTRESLKKRLLHHREKLMSLKSAMQLFKQTMSELEHVLYPETIKESEHVFKKIQRNHAMKHYKDLCSIQRNESSSLRKTHRNVDVVQTSKTSKDDLTRDFEINELFYSVDRSSLLSFMRLLTQFIISGKMCPNDCFLISCKVIGCLAKESRPAIRISEVFIENDLMALLTSHMKFHSNLGQSAWYKHAVTCLLQDMIEGEKLFGEEALKNNTIKCNATDNNKGTSNNLSSKNAEVASDEIKVTPSKFINDIKVNNLLGEQSLNHTPLAQAQFCDENVNTAKIKDFSVKEKKTVNVLFDVSTSSCSVDNAAGSNKLISGNQWSKSSADATKTASLGKSKVEVLPDLFDEAVAPEMLVDCICHDKLISMDTDESSLSEDTEYFDAEYMHEEFFQSMSQIDKLKMLKDKASVKKHLFKDVSSPSSMTHEVINNENDNMNSYAQFVAKNLVPLYTQLNHYYGYENEGQIFDIYSMHENGNSLASEIQLRLINSKHDLKLVEAISSTPSRDFVLIEKNKVFIAGNMNVTLSILSKVFQNIFSSFIDKLSLNCDYFDSLLEVFLSLTSSLENEYSDYKSPSYPMIFLKKETVSALFSFTLKSPNFGVKSWSLLLKVLSVCVNQLSADFSSNQTISSSDSSAMAISIITDNLFIPVFTKLFSTQFVPNLSIRNDIAGDSICRLLEYFLIRLKIRCFITNTDSSVRNLYKNNLLKLVVRLAEPEAPLYKIHGPLDLQKVFFKHILSLDYKEILNSHLPLTLINCVATVVCENIYMFQEFYAGSKQTLGHKNFEEIFATVFGAKSQKDQDIAANRSEILCSLIKLTFKFLNAPNERTTSVVKSPDAVSSNQYLTDALKLKQRQMTIDVNVNSPDEAKVLNPSTSFLGAQISSDSIFNQNPMLPSNIRNHQRIKNSNTHGDSCNHSDIFVKNHLADSIVQNNRTMRMLLHSFKHYDLIVPTPLSIVGGTTALADEYDYGNTVSGALYKLLLMINSKISNIDNFLTVLVNFMSEYEWEEENFLSQATFCLFKQIFDCKNSLGKFCAMNGAKILWNNLVHCTNSISNHPNSFVSRILNKLYPNLPPSPNTSFKSKPQDASNQNDSRKDLYDFAPLATVSSSNPTARPTEELFKCHQIFQRGQQSPYWSYNFSPEENWIDLSLTFPCPILLHEIHVKPHSQALGMCPSSISIEAGLAAFSLTPVSGLLSTAGLTCITMALKSPMVASVVLIRFYKPRDTSTIGLTQLKVLGTTAVKNSIWNLKNDKSLKSSHWWLKLIEHCVFDVPDGFNLMLRACDDVEGLIGCLVKLLTFSFVLEHDVEQTNILSSSLIELLIETIASHSSRHLCAFVHYVLDDDRFQLEPSGSPYLEAVVSIVLIIAKIAEGEKILIDRLKVSIQREYERASTASHNYELAMSFNADLVHCFSVVIWNASDKVVCTHFDEDSFMKLIYLLQKEDAGKLRDALDVLICALCKSCPNFFTKILTYFGVVTFENDAENSSALTDDRKDDFSELNACRTDDMKRESEEPYQARHVLQDCVVSREKMRTIAVATLCDRTTRAVIQSGFLLVLVHRILEWCKKELVYQIEKCSACLDESATDSQKVASDSSIPLNEKNTDLSRSNVASEKSTNEVTNLLNIVQALTIMSDQTTVKQWLVSEEGSVFWMPLLSILGDPILNSGEYTDLTSESSAQYCKLEDATISLMKSCCSNHEGNQKIFCNLLCQLIQRQKPPTGFSYGHSLSGFTRRLLLNLLLESQCILVKVTSTFDLINTPFYAVPPSIRHPKFGAGNKVRLLHIPICTKVEELIQLLTPESSCPTYDENYYNSNKEGFVNVDLEYGTFKREISEVSLDLVDRLALAAGIAAKGKRSRETVKTKETECNRDVSEKQKLNSKSNTKCTYGLINYNLLSLFPVIPPSATMGQIQKALKSSSRNQDCNLQVLNFVLINSKEGFELSDTASSLFSNSHQPLMLNLFCSIGGLSILAERMTLLYPDTSYRLLMSNNLKACEDEMDKSIEEITADGQLDTFGKFSSPLRVKGFGEILGVTGVPPHSLSSFVLFLRLPGYAELLLKDYKHACSLLRLALGSYEGFYSDNESANSFKGSLATLPFQVLEKQFKTTPLTTDDGLTLRRKSVKSGVVNLILACIVALSRLDKPDVVSSLHHENVPIEYVVHATHTSLDVHCNNNSKKQQSNNEKSQYWAKGTGFGTGSTIQSWNVEHALIKQKMQDEHIICLIKIIAQFIDPTGNRKDGIDEVEITSIQNPNYKPVHDLFENASTFGTDISYAQSEHDSVDGKENKRAKTDLAEITHDTNEVNDGIKDDDEIEVTNESKLSEDLSRDLLDLFLKANLTAIIASYLNNDSVLDISRHVELYQSILLLVKAIALTPAFWCLLWSKNDRNNDCRVSNGLPLLLKKFKKAVTTYLSKLNWNNVKKSEKNKNGEDKIDSECLVADESLSFLVPDIEMCAEMVDVAVSNLKSQINATTNEADNITQEFSQLSNQEIYSEVMKKLQFDVFDFIAEGESGEILFTIPYHYENLSKESNMTISNASRMKRLAQETVTLSTSLPLSYSSSVFVRSDTDRLDLMKVLITGPEDTPYANGCFEFDVFFPSNYPSSPLFINLQTTGEKKVRFNPNLYQDGKVCLSILNTWQGRPEEKWNPKTSSLLQVLVSIQSLILVPDPYFNEPGYEKSRGSQSGDQNSLEYDANIKTATVTWAILQQIRNPPACFKEVIENHFWLKRNDILKQVDAWDKELTALSKSKKPGRSIAHHADTMKKLHQLLIKEFNKMEAPKELAQSYVEENNLKTQNEENLSEEGAKKSDDNFVSEENEVNIESNEYSTEVKSDLEPW